MNRLKPYFTPPSTASPSPTPPSAVNCPYCGRANSPGAATCSYCGAILGTPINCPYCGRANSPGATNCYSCNAPLSPPTSSTLPCPACNRPILSGSKRCPYCHREVEKCPHCGNLILKGDTICKHCNSDIRVTKSVSLRESAGIRIQASTYETVISLFIGLACIFVTPFFGLPALYFLGAAFIIVKPLSIFIPNEMEIKRSVKTRRDIGQPLESRKSFLLLIKAILRTAYYSLFILQFATLAFPFSNLIALSIAFFYYMILPTRYKTTQLYQAFEAWVRLGFGVILSFLFLSTFGGAGPIGWSLFFMGLAFFVTFPVHIVDEDEKGKVTLNLMILDKFRNFHKAPFEKGLFSIFMVLSLISSFWYGGIIFNTAIFWTFVIVWAFSLLIGLGAGPEGRPPLGILMIIVSLFVFSSTYTGYMGQAIFGYWWPQVQAGMDYIGSILGPVWEQVQIGMDDSWLMLTNPAAYYEKMMRKQQATTTVIKEGGSPLSIESSRFELFTSTPGILDPELDVVIGSIELENKGEFDASEIEAKIFAEWIDPVKLKGTIVGKITKLECSGLPSPSDLPTQMGVCEWDGKNYTYPKEIKLCSFVFSKAGWNESVDLTETETEVVKGETLEHYVHGTNTVKFNLNYTYTYNVNVSIPVEVIDSELYEDLTKAREIRLQELTSKYSGGPVKATLWSQRQPVRDGDESLFVASLFNDGRGELIEIRQFEVSIHKDLADFDSVEIVEDGFTFDKCNKESEGDYSRIVCSFNTNLTKKPLRNGDYKRVSFFLKPNDLPSRIRKTSLIVGTATYRYKKIESQSLSIANSPMR